MNGTLEEAKADISGLWALQYLMDKGVLDRKQEKSIYMTFLASTFRTLRFGLDASHAKGMALQVNNLLDQGAISRGCPRTAARSTSRRQRKPSPSALTRQIMTLQAHGDYAGTKALLERMVVVRPEVQAVPG